MSIQRLTVVVDDGFIRVDDKSASGCDMSWVPTYHCEHVGYSTSVHAIQWIVDRGEIELCSGPWGTNMGDNVVITNLDDNNLGVGATTALNARLDAIAAEEAAAAAAAEEAEAASESYLSEVDLDSIIAALENAE
tara:strand:+ start:249 stop:653 length:405 start_codon:yes stop_codon:yes gene_type:complete